MAWQAVPRNGYGQLQLQTSEPGATAPTHRQYAISEVNKRNGRDSGEGVSKRI